MSAPSPSEYQEAFQNPGLALLDPELAAGEPRTNALGLPQATAGAFAVVFSIDTPTGRYAARCFLTESRDQEYRYTTIRRVLDNASLPFLAEFEYQKRGIRVGEGIHPLLKMKWMRGVPLNQYVASRLDRRVQLRALIDAWVELVRRLEEAGVAHGDLQHGNILVDEDVDGGLTLGLVDYDTLFVPDFRRRRSPEIGHRNYQHSERSPRHFDRRLDRFSALVIYVALNALVERPDLWAAYDSGENLLFQADDFYRPDRSALFDDLLATPAIRSMAAALEKACLMDPLQAPTVEEVRKAGESSSAAVPAVSMPEQGRMRHRTAFENGAIWMLAALLIVPAALSLWNVGAGAATMAMGLLGSGAWFLVQFRGREEVRRRSRMQDEIGQIRRIRSELEREMHLLEAERTRLSSDAAAEKHRLLDRFREDHLQDRLRYRFIGELETLDGITHKSVVLLKKAGIRTALHVTPERLDEVSGIGPQTRRRILAWHAGLVGDLLENVPVDLPDADVRRIEREAARKRDVVSAELDRVRRKVTVQADEEARVAGRLANLTTPSVVDYLAFVLRLKKGDATNSSGTT